MNHVILHNNPLRSSDGKHLTDPKYRPRTRSRTFDYVVHSALLRQALEHGLDPINVLTNAFNFRRPARQEGRYAYLLHIVAALKSTGKARHFDRTASLPGNAEADIRRTLIRKRLHQGIIGLPRNLFYGYRHPA